MILIEFPSSAGGRKHFKDLASLAGFIAKQLSVWSSGELGKNRIHNLNRIISSWNNLANQLQTLRGNYGDEDQERVVPPLNAYLVNQKLIEADGSVAQAISQVLKSDGASAANSAIMFVTAAGNEQVVHGVTKDQLHGIMSAWAAGEGIDRTGVSRVRGQLKRSLTTLEEDVIDHHKKLEERLAAISNHFDLQIQEYKAQKKWFSRAKMLGMRRISMDRAKWQTSWDDIYKLYIEHMRLDAAVTLWEGRAGAHEKDAVLHGRWALLIGAVGLGVAAGIATLTSILAKWLFATEFLGSNIKIPAGTLRPTWHFELMFTAAGTILYLTIFLWLVRIIVRMYMTDNHLAIDARSRAAMAHTYLALTKDNQADENDRAIVLASLFRPITDGFVKDDAMPLISPASILSAQLEKR
ncbi:MAG: DUF6161 domain-containing protein [Sphingobium phenoxybenzoativorans]